MHGCKECAAADELQVRKRNGIWRGKGGNACMLTIINYVCTTCAKMVPVRHVSPPNSCKGGGVA